MKDNSLLEIIEYELCLSDNKVYDSDRKEKIKKLLEQLNQKYLLSHIYNYQQVIYKQKKYYIYKYNNSNLELNIKRFFCVTKGSLRDKNYKDLTILVKNAFLTTTNHPVIEIELYRIDGIKEFERINYNQNKYDKKVAKKLKKLP